MNLLLCGQFAADEADAWARALRAALPSHRLWTRRGDCPDEQFAAAIVANPPPGSLQGLPGLRLIQSLWAGVDRLLDDASLPAGVPIARMVDPVMNQAMAETALWATLALHRGFFGHQARQRQGQWQPGPQRRADEVPVLVLGAGQMGRATARSLARQAYPVRLWRRGADGPASPGTGAPAALGVAGIASVSSVFGDAALAPALAEAEVVINLLPLTSATRGLINQSFLRAMRPGAGLVNLARGAHVVDDDLLAALDAGHLGHAVLDVFQLEPLPADHRFWQHPRVTMLPHVAALTDVRSAATVAARNIEALARGAPIAHLVAREAGY